MDSLASRRQDERGGTLVSSDGRALALKGAELHVHAKAGIARVTLLQTFANSYQHPLAVRYLLPLPADGAVSGFAFTTDDKRVEGRVEKREKARERYEQALLQGNTAALVEQTRTSLFEQEVGNIAPGQQVVCETIIDQPLKWLGSGQWEWRFPTVVGPRYLGDRVPDVDRLQVEVSAEPLPIQMALSAVVGDVLSGPVSSPSHSISVDRRARETRVELPEAARLDRDIVLRWKVAGLEPGVTLDVARPEAAGHEGSCYGLLTLVPPEVVADGETVPRDLIVLLDSSGSMKGAPLAQAKRVIKALIDSLLAHDRLELIEFSEGARRWTDGPVPATGDHKRAAMRWLDSLSARGGTEMKQALLEATSPLRTGSQRQIVLVTDGYIGFEREILEAVLGRLPSGCRIHTLGVGSAVNRTLTHGVARAGGGEEVVISVDEDVEPAVLRLSRRLERPLVTELSIEGDGVRDHAPIRLPDLYAAAPAMVALRLAEGTSVKVSGVTSTGPFVHELSAPELGPGSGNEAVVALYGREKVEDLETRISAGRSPVELDQEIEKLGVVFQLATRLTSWVAVGDRIEDLGPFIREQVPHEIPYGVSASAAGYGAAPPPPQRRGRVSVSRPRSFSSSQEATKTAITVVTKVADRKADVQNACLVMIYGGDLGKRVPLDREKTTIGRGSVADVQIDQESVSRSHCELINDGDKLTVRDVGSTNGTYVNDGLVDEQVLRDGDYVKVGRCIFKFLSGDNIEHSYHEEIYRMTTIDALTNTHNKRYFLETLDREVGRAHRYRRDLSLILFDIDKFKNINDSFGHLAGDSVLKQLAAAIASSVRRDDILARYGGEEFGLILPEMERRGALVVAEKIRELVEHTAFEFEGEKIPVTISLGVAQLHPEWTSEAFIKAADDNLYRAKNTGRNRVVG